MTSAASIEKKNCFLIILELWPDLKTRLFRPLIPNPVTSVFNLLHWPHPLFELTLTRSKILKTFDSFLIKTVLGFLSLFSSLDFSLENDGSLERRIMQRKASKKWFIVW